MIFAVARKILELPPDRAAAFAGFVSPLNAIYERVKTKFPTKRELCQKLTELPVTAPYPLEVPDVLLPMRELHLGACPLTRNSMMYKAKRLRRGLIMLSVITPLKLAIFARHVKEICAKCEPTSRTVDLMFSKVCKLAGCTWDVDELLELVNIESQADLLHHLPKTKVNTKRWHLKHVQKQVLNGLCWVWLVFQVCVGGDMRDFVRTMSSQGETLALLSLAWHGAVVRRVKQASIRPDFVLPSCFRQNSDPSAKNIQTMLYGPPLTLAIDYLWTYKHPPMSKARWWQLLGIWRLYERFGFRIHMCEQIHFVTSRQWLELPDMYGVFIEYGDSVIVHIKDSKVLKRKRSPGVHVTICDHGKWLNPSDKELFGKMYESYKTLFPEPRFYTGNLKKGTWQDIPIFVWSTPVMPEYHEHFAVFTHSGDTYIEARNKAFKHIKTRKDFLESKEVKATHFPPRGTPHDYSISGRKQVKTSEYLRETLDVLISEFGSCSEVLGKTRLSGRVFTKANLKTLEILGRAFREKKLHTTLQYAGRYVNQSRIMGAQSILKELGLPDVLEERLRRVREIEAHKSCEMHYHKLEELPLVRGRVTKRTYTEDLVESTPDDANIWERCTSMKRLTLYEQIQQLEYFARWKIVYEVYPRWARSHRMARCTSHLSHWAFFWLAAYSRQALEASEMGVYKLALRSNQMEGKILSNVHALIPRPDFADSYVCDTPLKYIRLRIRIRLAYENMIPRRSWLSGDPEFDLKWMLKLAFNADEVITLFEQFLLESRNWDDRTQEALIRNHKYLLKCASRLREYYTRTTEPSRDWKLGDVYKGDGFSLKIVPHGLLAKGKVRLKLNLQEVEERVYKLIMEDGFPDVSVRINGVRYFYPHAHMGKPIWAYAQRGEITADIKDGWLVSRQRGIYMLAWEKDLRFW